ncbi:hypothetical protein D3C71_517630 [compost metagenome]
MLLTQLNQSSIVVEYGIRISYRLLRINLFVIRINRKPWSSGGEPGLRAAVPLHWSTGIVPAFAVNGLHNRLLIRALSHVFFMHIKDFNILIVFN